MLNKKSLRAGTKGLGGTTLLPVFSCWRLPMSLRAAHGGDNVPKRSRLKDITMTTATKPGGKQVRIA
ncbi:MAG: hypothetical protein GX853_02515 [Chloroflexi bacterium]|jgi:hypothetical protein|nr:hypothetical protein [Chloroflexota bacterium]